MKQLSLFNLLSLALTRLQPCRCFLVFLFLFLFFLLTLSACTTVAYNTASTINSNLSLGDQVQDKVIKYKAWYRLHQMDFNPNKNFIEVVTYDGRLVLLGEVESEELKNKINQNLAQIPGVYHVDDYLRVTHGALHSWPEWGEGALLTAKVKAAILFSGVNDFHYEIYTDNDVVYLFGQAAPAEEAKVLNIVRNLSGVKEVVTIFPKVRQGKALIIAI